LHRSWPLKSSSRFEKSLEHLRQHSASNAGHVTVEKGTGASTRLGRSGFGAADATSPASRCPAPAAPSSTAAGPVSRRPTGKAADAPQGPAAPSAADSTKPPPADPPSQTGAQIHDDRRAKPLDTLNHLSPRNFRLSAVLASPVSTNTLGAGPVARRCGCDSATAAALI